MKKILIIITLTLVLILCNACGDTSQKLTDDAITALIDIDLQISKFLYTEPPASNYSDTAEYNGREYYRVEEEEFDTWDEWDAFIRGAYCGQLAKDALATDTVVNIEGNTYSNGGSRGYDLSDNYTYEITSSDGNTVTVLMRNPSRDPEDNYVNETTYTFKLTNDGWRIENKF